MTLKIDGKSKEKVISCFKYDKNLVSVNPNIQKTQKLAL